MLDGVLVGGPCLARVPDKVLTVGSRTHYVRGDLRPDGRWWIAWWGFEASEELRGAVITVS